MNGVESAAGKAVPGVVNCMGAGAVGDEGMCGAGDNSAKVSTAEAGDAKHYVGASYSCKCSDVGGGEVGAGAAVVCEWLSCALVER